MASKTISFTYDKVQDKEGKIRHYPVANVVLIWKEESFETTAIIDSGSDVTMIPLDIAEALGLEKGEEGEVETVGGHKIKTWRSKVNFIFRRGTNRISLNGVPVDIMDVDMTKEPAGDIILGRTVIFDHFKITFIQHQKKVIFEKIDPKWYKY